MNVQAPLFISHWRLLIQVKYGLRSRTVFLDYVDRVRIEEQLHQLDQNTIDAYRLIEFTNEAKELLAIVALGYVGHSVTAVQPNQYETTAPILTLPDKNVENKVQSNDCYFHSSSRVGKIAFPFLGFFPFV